MSRRQREEHNQVMKEKAIEAEEHAQLLQVLAREQQRTRDLQQQVARQGWQSARTDKGLQLTMAIQRREWRTAQLPC